MHKHEDEGEGKRVTKKKRVTGGGLEDGKDVGIVVVDEIKAQIN